ncbi:peptide/nickel transport system substrate-binding protein/microcin C transport system substrate-binding protein [Stella humosa]|uniref:Peptide/nickel transport system substrate-binding protein/microcin C transport system substrate-binding protein n=1 Tax=Stella humosa TaxID=94 RepID=A0A3N1KT46_9PROT|nr:extracellular solute-binding protein [Stella humosa]ROP83164.1 peptide/nickel transport system substrate-binding protein/microcin C transport system substrate-binding protein [Stella humosa]BBK30059.1 ABC transporter substrate-binding protein [Stella humosa]
MSGTWRRLRLALAALYLLGPTAAAAADHAIAMHGEPALAPGFAHLPYADPAAPKGGRMAAAAFGSFDSLNPFVIRGVPARGVRQYVFESLLARNEDEPFTLYGLLAAKVEVPPDRAWVAFTLDPAARFQNGDAVTVDDVLFSLDLLRRQGRPNHRHYYSKVTATERIGQRTVKLVFDGSGDRELPLILGLMPVLPRSVYGARAFDQGTLELPVGSGPYRVEKVEPGRQVVYRRDPDWWGRDRPVNRGRFNFDEIRYDYFREANVAFEAFKAGLLDVRVETSPARWATGYDFPAMADGRVTRAEIGHGRPSGMFGFVLNARRPALADPAVRAALVDSFDFEWANRMLFHGTYRRIASYFDNSPLAATGPASPAERALLAPFLDRLPPGILEAPPPALSGDGSGQDRAQLRRVFERLAAAGWRTQDGRMVQEATGQPLAFEILLVQPEHERIGLHWARTLRRLGIEVQVRTVDSAQYQGRLENFDFDVVVNLWANSLSPGNEQSFYWGQEAARQEGSRNYPGVAEPAVDAAIASLVESRTRDELVTAARALDRLLLAGHHVVPLWYEPVDRIAWSTRLGRPPRSPATGVDFDGWWQAR